MKRSAGRHDRRDASLLLRCGVMRPLDPHCEWPPLSITREILKRPVAQAGTNCLLQACEFCDFVSLDVNAYKFYVHNAAVKCCNTSKSCCFSLGFKRNMYLAFWNCFSFGWEASATIRILLILISARMRGGAANLVTNLLLQCLLV